MKTPEPSKENPSAPSKRQFTGTDNPRHLRALAALMRRPVPREQLDRIAGCSNGPELVAELRRRGLGYDALLCERVKVTDRDGNVCRHGVYALTDKGRKMVCAWLATLPKGEAP